MSAADTQILVHSVASHACLEGHICKTGFSLCGKLLSGCQLSAPNSHVQCIDLSASFMSVPVLCKSCRLFFARACMQSIVASDPLQCKGHIMLSSPPIIVLRQVIHKNVGSSLSCNRCGRLVHVHLPHHRVCINRANKRTAVVSPAA